MMIDLEDKRIKIAVTSVVIVGFVTYYFYPKDDYVMEMVKPTRPPVEKIEKIEETPKKENIVISKVEEMKAKIVEEKQIIERGKILFTETDSSGKYTIQLINDIDINLKSKDNRSDSQQEVDKKREAIKRQLYGDQATQSQAKALNKVPDNQHSFEQSKTPKRREIANGQKETVNRDKIARDLLAERDKQKEQARKIAN